MARVIDFAEVRRAREEERARAGASQRRHLERAIAVLRESLAETAARLAAAPPGEQAGLLRDVERLAALIRYGMRMLGEPVDADSPPPRTLESG
jgi:hypothetical protein